MAGFKSGNHGSGEAGAKYRAEKAAKKRLEQVEAFNKNNLKRALKKNYKDSEVRRRAIRQSEGQLARAVEAKKKLESNPDLSSKEIKEIALAGTVSDDTLKRARDSKSDVRYAESPTGDNFDQGFTNETKELGYVATGSKFEEDRKVKAQEIRYNQQTKT